MDPTASNRSNVLSNDTGLLHLELGEMPNGKGAKLYRCFFGNVVEIEDDPERAFIVHR